MEAASGSRMQYMTLETRLRTYEPRYRYGFWTRLFTMCRSLLSCSRSWLTDLTWKGTQIQGSASTEALSSDQSNEARMMAYSTDDIDKVWQQSSNL